MNALAHAASPYLLEHADDPVDWHPWGEEAFAEARRRDVPLLISIGYASCHWCHVMQHESFQDPQTAAYLNAHFVPVKVDREEHPDVDTVYMTALQALRGQGGWPLTAVTDPHGRTFFAGSYFPPDDRPGMPSFRRVLHALSEAWDQRRDEVLRDAEQLDRHLRSGMGAPPAVEDPLARDAHPTDAATLPDGAAEALEVLEQRFDPRNAGFGGAPKFPPHTLLRWLSLRPEAAARRMQEATLRALARGGIHDPLAGGTARYAVDADWRVPHFEKMLSDNVQLLPRWAEAFVNTGDPTFERAALDTFTFLEAELRLPDGGYATALDADSVAENGTREEGAYYAWRADAFDAAVSEGSGADEIAFARAAFDVEEPGPFEGLQVLRIGADAAELAERFEIEPEQAAKRLEQLRAALFAVRERRPRPPRDDKVLTGLQGLAILGLARAGRLLEHAQMILAAQRTARHVLATQWLPGGRLARRALGAEVGIDARLDDHAYLGLGLLELHRADGDPRWLDEATARAEQIAARFEDDEGGFYGVASDQVGPLPLRPRTVTDAAVPADTLAAAELLWRCARLWDRSELEESARRAVVPLAPLARRHPEAFGSVLTLLDLMRAPRRELAVTGPDEAGGRALWLVAARRSLDAWAVQRAAEPHDGPLVAGRHTVDGAAAAWLCERYACRLPERDPAELERALADG